MACRLPGGSGAGAPPRSPGDRPRPTLRHLSVSTLPHPPAPQIMALSYAVVAPLVIPPAVAFFFVAWVVWRYHGAPAAAAGGPAQASVAARPPATCLPCG